MFTQAHRPYVSTYEGFKTLAHTPGSDTPQAQRDRANASAAEAWQRVAELEAVLKTISGAHVPSNPLESLYSDHAWALRHVGYLRRIASDALLAKSK